MIHKLKNERVPLIKDQRHPSAPGETRTRDQSCVKGRLYPLSYGRTELILYDLGRELAGSFRFVDNSPACLPVDKFLVTIKGL